MFVGSGLKNLNKKEFLNLNIAIPPIEIQNKIVEILDKLQAYTKDIQTGLPLEIDQRKKQYEHYRDKLLNFKEKNTKI
ncbi:restriction endonuclease subunit S [Metamycoplasma hominis]|uniref:restriction endonuclease subunit S n=1 Tax=Metamycoplasma hominis TaxID=2098 RepID=UPI00280B3D54|nr:restriction endonuclease subunit S [Metamycoplasma hominis]